jgi:hypothetical protein
LHHPSQSIEEQTLPLSGQMKFPCSFGSGVVGLPWVLPLEAEGEEGVGVEEAEVGAEPPYSLDSQDSPEIPES